MTVRQWVQGKVPVWSSLLAFSRSKFVQSSGIWVVLVPIIARATEKIERAFSVTVGSTVLTFHLHLPFSWTLFFFGALCFLAGNVIVQLRCFRILKETNTFRDFHDQGRSIRELCEYAKWWVPSDPEKLNEALRVVNTLEDVDGQAWGQGSLDEGRVERKLREAYSAIVSGGLDYFRVGARSFATFCYALGLIFFGSVLSQSTWYVMKRFALAL